MSIRPEQETDFGDIDKLVGAAFNSSVEPKLVNLIRESPNYVPELSFVAEIDGKVVGHIMLSHVELKDGADRHRVLSLSPLAVAPDAQKKGVGGALIHAALEAADHMGEPLVVLEGSPRYYPRFGFLPASDFGITIDLPDWAAPEAARVFPLSRYNSWVKGHVVYPPAFGQAESLRESSTQG